MLFYLSSSNNVKMQNNIHAAKGINNVDNNNINNVGNDNNVDNNNNSINNQIEAKSKFNSEVLKLVFTQNIHTYKDIYYRMEQSLIFKNFIQ